MRKRLLLVLAVAAGCDRAASSLASPTHVVEDLLAAMDAVYSFEGPVSFFETWENIPDLDLAVEIREYAERTEAVNKCRGVDCTGPDYPWAIEFIESLDPDDPGNLKVGLLSVGGDCICGPIFTVEVTRRAGGGWMVGKAEQTGYSWS